MYNMYIIVMKIYVKVKHYQFYFNGKKVIKMKKMFFKLLILILFFDACLATTNDVADTSIPVSFF